MRKKTSLKEKRLNRVRIRIAKRSEDRHRLSVFRSNKNIYAQVIDDLKGKTIVSASTLESSLRSSFSSGATKEAAAAVGKLLAEKAEEKGLEKVVFDRGPYLFHGRVKALADAARNSGLKF